MDSYKILLIFRKASNSFTALFLDFAMDTAVCSV